MKLRTKFAVILVVVTLVLSVGVYGGLEVYKDQLVSQAQDNVDETAALTAAQVDATLEQRKDYIGYVASRPRAAEFDSSDEYLREIVRNSRFFAAQIVDANGTIVNLHGDITQDIRQEAIGSNVRNRSYVTRALGGQVYVTEPEFVNATQSHLVIIGAPIFEGGDIVGVLAASIYVDQQTFFSGLVPLETSTQTVSVQTAGTQLYEPGSQFSNPITGRATVDETGWTVTVYRDRSSLLEQLRGLAIAQALGLFLILLSVVGFGIWEYRRTFEQTERLLDAFHDLEAGNFDRRLSLRTGEEWEQISEGFNDLAGGLAARERDLKRHEQRLEVLNRVLRHNIRNLTTVMLGYAEIVQARAEDPEVRGAAESIMETGMELTDLGDQARQIQATIGTREAERLSIDISAAVESIAAETRNRFPDVTVDVETADDAMVLAIPSIEDAIRHLVENACEHNPGPDPWVSITIIPDGDRVRVMIEDNGPGIPEGERAVLLEEGQETQLEHSSGLGLWLAYWTIDRSGGDLTLSERRPSGTVVEIELERVRTANAATDDGVGDPTSAGDSHGGDEVEDASGDGAHWEWVDGTDE